MAKCRMKTDPNKVYNKENWLLVVLHYITHSSLPTAQLSKSCHGLRQANQVPTSRPGLDHIFIQPGLTPPSLSSLLHLHGNSSSLGTIVTIKLHQNYKYLDITSQLLWHGKELHQLTWE